MYGHRWLFGLRRFFPIASEKQLMRVRIMGDSCPSEEAPRPKGEESGRFVPIRRGPTARRERKRQIRTIGQDISMDDVLES